MDISCIYTVQLNERARAAEAARARFSYFLTDKYFPEANHLPKTNSPRGMRRAFQAGRFDFFLRSSVSISLHASASSSSDSLTSTPSRMFCNLYSRLR